MPRESPLPGRLFLCFSRSFFRHPKREKNYRQKVWIVHFITYFCNTVCKIAKQTPNFTPKNVKLGVFVLFKMNQASLIHTSLLL